MKEIFVKKESRKCRLNVIDKYRVLCYYGLAI